MDSNNTEAKLSNQDSFNQVKGINDRKKENTGYRVLAGARTRAEHRQQWAKSHTLWDWNGRRGGYAQKAVPEITREFRVVRDNRMNQNTMKDTMLGSLQNSPEDNHGGASNVQNRSGKIIDYKYSAQGNSDGRGVSQNLDGRCDSDPGHGKDEKSSGSEKASLAKEKQLTVSSSTGMMPKEVKNKSQVHAETFPSANSAIGVYSSSSDPVHVPSSRSAGPVGAIRREVGVVGVRQRSSDHSAACTSNSGNSIAVLLSERDSSSSRHSTITFKSNNPSSVSKPTIPSTSIRKAFSASQYDVKPHHQVVGRQRATWTNKAWKPKSIRKPNSDCPDAITQSGQVRAADLSEELLQVNIYKNVHVIIPHHLRVPESEQAGLMFGSFGAECNSTKSFVSASREFKNEQESSNGQASSSTCASIPVVFEDSVGDESGPVESQFRTSNDSTSDEAELPLPINDESISPRDIESYPDIGLIQSHADSYESHEPREQQGPPSLADFSAYDPQMRFDISFSKMTLEDNAQAPCFSSTPEPQALSTHATDARSFSSMPLVQQQQQTFTQLYPQVHISHYPNIVPYRQIVSPLYVPQLLVPNYSTSSVPTHPSSGSNYFMMPGGSPQLTRAGMKYGPSQYKTVQAGTSAGYATYTNSGGYTAGTIGSTAGMADMTRISFKDNNLYVPNPQSDVDMWIQSPRDLAILQSTPCYSLSGQAQPHPAYLPGVHGANPALNQAAFTSPHLQYPGLYQPSQQGSLAGQTSNIIHQQVLSGLAGNSGMGMVPTATAQVGAYQPSQPGHLGWINNY